MAKIKIEQNQPGNIEVAMSGDLNIYSVAEIFEKLQKELQFEDNIKLDFKEITELDTAGLQLFIMLIKHAKEQGCHVDINVMSDVVKQSVNQFNLQRYFPMANSEETI